MQVALFIRQLSYVHEFQSIILILVPCTIRSCLSVLYSSFLYIRAVLRECFVPTRCLGSVILISDFASVG